MDLKDLRRQAREYIETITASNPTPAETPFLTLPCGQPPSTAALVEHLKLAHLERDKLQVYISKVISTLKGSIDCITNRYSKVW